MLCLLLQLTVYAEATAASRASADVIAGFEPLGESGTIATQYKLALVTLEKRFPEQLSVRLEGDGAYQRIPVTWKCVEDYDEVYDTYHFTPVLEGYTIAEGAEPPVVSVRVLGESAIPPLNAAAEGRGSSIPISRKRVSKGASDLASYNSFEAGRLPAVRNQAPYGSCWSFSAIGAVEADLISDGAGTDIDLSELHLAYYAYHSYYDEKNCAVGDKYDYEDADYVNAGGGQNIAFRVFSNLVGPASEASVPYAWGHHYRPGPFDGRAFKTAQLLNAYELNPRDTAGIKAAIKAHGGVAASIYWDNEFYSYTYNSLYCPKRHLPNHAIMLVGWDDNFSRNNFGENPPAQDGAWLVRNSWGLDDYGREGYFWLSYTDPSYLREAVYVFDATSGQYDHCYSYASVPNSLNIYDFSGSVTAVQHFTVDGGEEIRAVGFETFSSGLDVRIELTLDDQTVQTSAAADHQGYYTVRLSEPLVVAQRSDVTVTMTYQGDDIRIPTEYAGTVSYSDESSTGFCGSGGLVLNGDNTGEDGLIKLFTMDCDVPGEGVRISPENFPDNAFRNYISSSFDKDHNGYLSDEEIAAVTVIDFIPADDSQDWAVSDQEDDFKTPGPVRSLEGIAYFTELQTLSCAGNQLETIDVSRNTKLQDLNCNDNLLPNLDLSKNTELRKLSCVGNALTGLDVSQCPALVALIGDTLPDLDRYTVVFSGEGRFLAYDLGVELTPSFHLGTGLPIDGTSFPDATFRGYITVNCDLDGDGTLTDHELSAVKYIDCSGSATAPGNIASLNGVEHFPSLETLVCSHNQLTALDVGHNPALKTLYCRNNLLEQLDLRGNTALRNLDCRENPALAGLELGGCCEMLKLDCSSAALASLDLGDCRLLEELSCGDNPALQALNISGCSALRTLSCGNVQVPGLDLSGREQLTKLECGGNPVLTSVNVGNCAALTVLSCKDCPQLETLNIRGCEDLSTLECCNCHLSEINLNSCQWLSNMTCYGNRIKALDLLPSYALSAITEYYSPVIENDIAYYNYEGHKIAFDASVVLVNVEPDFILPDNLIAIDEEAFMNCAFRHVVLSGSTESIGARAFAGCRELLCVRIPNGAIDIDEHAFGDLKGLVIFGVPGGNAEAFAQAHGYSFIPIE